MQTQTGNKKNQKGNPGTAAAKPATKQKKAVEKAAEAKTEAVPEAVPDTAPVPAVEQPMSGEVSRVIPVGLISANPFDDRGPCSEEKLLEMAASITRHGVLQPIVVRPVGDGFVLVFGTRRYMASLVAERQYIPAFVREYTDEQAAEITLVENLQREDTTPVAQAKGFARLMDMRRCTAEQAAEHCGVNGKFVRTRLRLLDLVADVAAMLDAEAITLGMAQVLCQYPDQSQQQVYDDHLSPDCRNSWRDLPVREFARIMESTYAGALDTFPFEKSDCLACVSNSATSELFPCEGGCGKCLKPSCMMAKQFDYMKAACKAIADATPETNFFIRPSSDADPRVVEHLESLGFVLLTTDEPKYLPEKPEMPVQGDMPDEQFAALKTEYDSALAKYNQVGNRLADGSAELMVEIGGRYPIGCFRLTAKAKEQIETAREAAVKGTKPAKAEQAAAKVQKAGKAPQPNAVETVAELEARIEKHKLDAQKKIALAVAEFLKKAEFPEADLLPVEENAMYFIMLDALRPQHCGMFGFEPGQAPNDIEKATAVTAMTPQQKMTVIRDFIVAHVTATQEGLAPTIAKTIAEQLFPADFGAITKKAEDKIKKSVEGLQGRIEAIRKKTGKKGKPAAGAKIGEATAEPVPVPVAENAGAPVDVEFEEITSDTLGTETSAVIEDPARLLPEGDAEAA